MVATAVVTPSTVVAGSDIRCQPLSFVGGGRGRWCGRPAVVLMHPGTTSGGSRPRDRSSIEALDGYASGATTEDRPGRPGILPEGRAGGSADVVLMRKRRGDPRE